METIHCLYIWWKKLFEKKVSGNSEHSLGWINFKTFAKIFNGIRVEAGEKKSLLSHFRHALFTILNKLQWKSYNSNIQRENIYVEQNFECKITIHKLNASIELSFYCLSLSQSD